MKTTSVIDTVSVDIVLAQADEDTRIPVGGIAHAGPRGISEVEVRVDDAPWNEGTIASATLQHDLGRLAP